MESHVQGKTQLIKGFCGSRFELESSPTLDFLSYEKDIVINNIKYTLLLWDTSGKEKFRSHNKSLLEVSNIFILVYDITRKDTFYNIYLWNDEIKDMEEDAIIGFVGTHLDLFGKREVETKFAENFADSIGAKFIEKYGNKNKKNRNNNIFPKKPLKEFIKNSLLKFYKY